MRWYFDFISPFAYLQSTRLEQLSAIEPVQCEPVLFAGLLNHWGSKGPAELPPKRQWTFEHVAWIAHRDNIPLVMPSHHPFNPLPLLRLAGCLNHEMAKVQRIFRWVWVEGHTPDDQSALADLCAEFGLTATDLNDPAIKSAVRQRTDAAIANGIFGVPTIEFQDQLFWGDDATDMMLAKARANGDESIYPAEAISAASKMPEGTARRVDKLVLTANPISPSNTHSIKPKIPFLPLDLTEPAELVAAVRKRRGGALIELDRMLLYSPPLTAGWNQFLGAVRTQLSLEPKLGELVICAVAMLNCAQFEFGQHAPLYIAAGGTKEQTDALADPEKALTSGDLFAPAERAALQLCIEMTRHIKVSDATFKNCLEYLPNQAVVELVATIAAYNMVSRFLVALNVHAQSEH